MKKDKKRHSIRKTLCILLMAVFGMTVLHSDRAEADAVTDTLTVLVGYQGMDLSEYAATGTYHWGELEGNLPIYEYAYSYYQSGWGTEYTSIVDSARGFLVEDLLDYAGINFGDIYNLQFYVVDHSGIQAAFDRDSLFCQRYYFDNLALHRKIHYGTKEVQKTVTTQVPHEETKEVEVQVPYEVEKEVEVLDEEGNPVLDDDGNPVTEIVTETEYRTEIQTVTETVYEDVTETVTETVTDYTNITGYSFDECWNYAYSVPPMLALEDSWIGYSQEFESIGPNFETMSASNRFRLLFGQTSPTETLTNASAKYVSRLYVTLYGAPVIGEMPELENTLGSHEVTTRVKVDDYTLMNALSQYMRVNSTDESVMKITSVEYTPVAGYSDLVDVTITYEIVGEGTASITAGFGGGTETQQVSAPVTIPAAEPTPTAEPTITPTATPNPSASQTPSPQGEGSETQAPVPTGGGTATQTPVPAETSAPAETSEPQETPGSTEAEDERTAANDIARTPTESDPARKADNEEQSSERTQERDSDVEVLPDPQAAIPDEAEALPSQPDEVETEMLEADELPVEQSESVFEIAEAEETAEAGETAVSDILTVAFRLSDTKTADIENVHENMGGSTAAAETEYLPAATDITQLKIEDTTEKQEDQQRRILMWTGLVAAIICVLGACAEAESFKIRLKGRKNKKNKH